MRPGKHSYELASILDNFKFNPSDYLVSVDVQSLFTKVPIAETLVIVERRLNELQIMDSELLKGTTSFSIKEVMALLEFVLSDCYFVFAGHLY